MVSADTPVLYLEPVGGIAGDMFLAAALDLGVTLESLEGPLRTLGLDGWSLRPTRQARRGLAGMHLEVLTGPHAHEAGAGDDHHAHRSFTGIRALIEASGLSGATKRRAIDVFTLLGEAEAFVHGVSLEQIHFHEVGAVDSIVDICGAALALELLGSPVVFTAPPPLGSGTVRIAHGLFPVPVPATLQILRDCPVLFEGEGELTTPTGAALLRAFATFAPPPPLRLTRVGYGLGTRELSDRPNALRATLGRAVPDTRRSPSTGELPAPSAVVPRRAAADITPPERAIEPQAAAQVLVAAQPAHGECWELACNLDDCSPQLLGALIEDALAAGALDAWIAPVVMKKGRPGHLVGVLVEADRSEALTELLLRESTTLGVRAHRVERAILDRRVDSVELPWGTVRVKVGLLNGTVYNVAPEYEDCRSLAAKNGVPLKEVQAAAAATWRTSRAEGPTSRARS